MRYMSVTLEVSKLSGWLNADADLDCRESKGGHTVRGDVRAGRREAAGDRGASRAQGRGLDCRLGAGHGEERTENMRYMAVTLEVSKLSGWLNADADCRESKGGHTVRGDVRPGRREAAGDRGARSVQGRGLDCRLGVGHGEERTSNM
eukprot:scaffold26021_cov41-Phaeocystis_antarctica.AAC.2